MVGWSFLSRSSMIVRWRPARGLVQLFEHGAPLNDVREVHHAGLVDHDGLRVRIPAEEQVARLDDLRLLHVDRRAVRHREPAAHLAVGRLDDDLAFARRDDALSVRILDGRYALQPHDAADLRLPLVLLRLARAAEAAEAAEVKRAQSELRARLADGLRRQNPHRLANVHGGHGRQVAAVAHLADAARALAREHRADLDRLNAGPLDGLRRILRNDRVAFEKPLPRARIEHVLRRHVADDPVGQRLDDVLAFLQGAHVECEDRAAVAFRDRHVLRDVDQSPRQIARVRRLQRRIGQSLACAVRRKEVFADRQTLPEVGHDGRLDDLDLAALLLLPRLGHEAARSGQLPHLVQVPAGARRHHHEHRIEAALRPLEVIGHRVRNIVRGMRPRVDDLVVPLAFGDDAVVVRTPETRGFVIGATRDVRLLGRHDQIVDAHRDASHRRVAKPEILQVVEKACGLGKTGVREAFEHEIRQFALAERLVQETNGAGDDGIEQHPADRGRNPRRLPVLPRAAPGPEPTGRAKARAALIQRHLDFAVRRKPQGVGIVLGESLLGPPRGGSPACSHGSPAVPGRQS